jgi:hypothetical protein
VKTKHTSVFAILLVVFSLIDTRYAAAQATPTAPTEAENVKPTPAKKIKPHSHVEERTGVPQSIPKEKSPEEIARIKKLHNHQRDAK